jgi:hypothetical protein
MRNFRPLAFLAFYLACLTAPAAGQELTPGSWTGTMVPPEGVAAPVTYEVTQGDDRPAIVMTVEGMAPRPLQDVRLDGGTLSFSFDMGRTVRCTLARQPGGSFAGPCGDGGRGGTLTMTPPG